MSFCLFFWFFGGRGEMEGFGAFYLMDGGDNVTLMSELLGKRGNTWLTRSGLAEHVSYVTREIR